MNQRYVEVKMKGSTCFITLNRPEALNALNMDLVDELFGRIKGLEAQESVRFVVLQGVGKTFCSGADIKEGDVFDKKRSSIFLDKLNTVTNIIEDSEKIYFALINGYALGGGFELVLACDFRFATKSSKFALPEVKLGVIPGAGGCARAVKVCGYANAVKIILTGRSFIAKEMFQMGTLHEVVDDSADLEKELAKYIGCLKKNAPRAVGYAKKCLNSHFGQLRTEYLKKERNSYKKLLDTYDKREGIKAFLEKRKPVFKGK